MFNNKRYETSDTPHPAYIFKNGGYVDPAYPSDIVVLAQQDIVIKDFELLDALKHRLKRAKKKQDSKKIQAIKVLLKEIKEYGR